MTLCESTSITTRSIMVTFSSPTSGYFHACKLRVPVGYGDEVHLIYLALVLLEGGNLLRIGRPQHDRAIGMLPASVVGGVAEVLHTILRQLRLFAGCNLAHPEVPVANKDRLASIGRQLRRTATVRGDSRLL